MAKANKLTKGAMKKTFNLSILEYEDVREAADLAWREGFAEGLKRAKERKRMEERSRLIEKCCKANLSIQQIAEVLRLPAKQRAAILNR
jgi:hypothetical protein